MNVYPSPLACNTLRGLAVVLMATAHSTTTASTAELQAIPEVSDGGSAIVSKKDISDNNHIPVVDYKGSASGLKTGLFHRGLLTIKI